MDTLKVPVFFIVDTSSSVKKSTTSEELSKYINTIIRFYSKNTDIRVRDSDDPSGIPHCNLKVQFAILVYNSISRWLTDGLIESYDIDDYGFRFNGLSDMGLALDELNKRLSVYAFLDKNKDNCLPTIFFITDGKCTDDYEKKLEVLKTNIWFEHATKIAVYFEKCSDTHTKLGGELCLKIHEMNLLYKIPLTNISFIYDMYNDILEPSNYLKRELYGNNTNKNNAVTRKENWEENWEDVEW